MERPELLFAKYDFYSAVRAAPEALAKAVESLPDERLFEENQAQLIAELVAEHLIQVPVLDLNAIIPVQREIDLDVSGDSRRFSGARISTYRVKATEISFRVAFTGDREIFRCRPSTYSMNPPTADIEHDAIVIRIARQDHNSAEYRNEFDRRIHQIQESLNQLRADCAGLEQTLRQTAAARIANRREKRQKDRDLIDELGFGKAKK